MIWRKEGKKREEMKMNTDEIQKPFKKLNRFCFLQVMEWDARVVDK